MKTNNRKGQTSLSSVLSKERIRTASPLFCSSSNGSAATVSDRLAALGITTCEELLSHEYAYGIKTIAAAAGLEEQQVFSAVSASKKKSRKGIRSDFIRTGLFKTSPHDDHSSSDTYDLEIKGDDILVYDHRDLAFRRDRPLPKSINLIGNFMPPTREGQGNRGTCVAFATCALLEYELAHARIKFGMDLSEQYHYWLCKKHDGINTEGTHPKISFHLSFKKGLIPEAFWPYVKVIDRNNTKHVKPSEEVKDSPRYHPTTVYSVKDFKNIDSIKQVLVERHPVAIGIPVFATWDNQPLGRITGNYGMPYEGEKNIGFHCLVLVGYNDNPKLHGGGEFLVRNSWGHEWGRDCKFGKGYGTLPYEFIKKYNILAYWLKLDRSKEEKIVRVVK